MKLTTIAALGTALGAASMVAACAVPPPPPAPPLDTSAESVPASPAPAAAKPADESLTIDFPMAGAALSPAAQAQLDGAARLYRDARPEVMIVSGHTDKSGSEFENLVLSARRASMVKRGLVDRGVPAERLQIIAIGEAEPTPATTATRSVVVTWR